MRIECIRASLAVGLLVAVSPLAQAQMGFNQIGNNGKPAAPAAKIAPPPALPGAESNRPVVPATRPTTDMEPTDALFDAINRGDIASARDAISRGADMRGHNVLGMTPLELSVDLGRNDICFMLLSMRAGDNDRGSQPTSKVAAAKPAPTKQARQAAPRPARVAAVSAPAPAQAARLFSGDGGSPNPNAGFLGFDTSRR